MLDWLRSLRRLRAQTANRLHTRDEAGQGLAEYALILGLIAVVCAAALATFGTAVANLVGWTLFQNL